MSDIPFRFKNRTSQVTGFIPDATGICDGEFFIQQADKAILFKDVDGNLVQVKNIQTGSFITTGQTGSFGGGNVDLSSYVTTGQTGVFALSSNTGSFVTTAQTGVFALSANTGSFVTTGQTGNFIALSTSNILATRTDAAKGTISSSTSSAIIGGCGNSVSSTALGSIFGGCQNSTSSLVGNNTIIGGASNTSNGNVGVVVGGFLNSISAHTSNFGGVFAGQQNTADGCQVAIVGGISNTINHCSCQSAIVSSCSSRVSGVRSVIIGGFSNCITGLTNSVILGGQNIVANTNNTVFANNFCSTSGKYYGDGSSLTGLATGSFITTSQTGIFALAANTGSFVTTGQTGTLCVNNLCVNGGYISVGGIEENFVTCTDGASGLINFDVCAAATMYYIGNSTANFGLNLRSNSSTTLNSILDTNKTLTVSFLNTNGITAYILTGVSIDGSGRSIKWLNGSSATGNIGSIDSYSITAIKTGDNLYTVLGSQGKFI